MRTNTANSRSFIRLHCTFNTALPRIFLLFIGIFVCVASERLNTQTVASGVMRPQATPTPDDKASPPSAKPSPSPIVAIPLPQIADQAEELDRALREISKSFVPNLDLVNPEGTDNADEISQGTRQVEDMLAGIPNMIQLQDQDRYWRAMEEEYARKRKLLTSRAAAIDEKMQWLDKEKKRWEATSEQVFQASGPEEVTERIRQELNAIQTLRTQTQEQLNVILALQNRIADQDRQISTVLRKLDEAHEHLRSRLLERDSQPLWGAWKIHAPDQPFGSVIHISASHGFTGTWNFLRLHKTMLLGIGAIYISILLIAFRFRSYVAAEDRRDTIVNGAQVFLYPFSVALLLTLLTTIRIVASAPSGLSFIVCLLYLVPLLRLLPVLIPPGMRMILYTLCVFSALKCTYLVLQFGVVFKRELFALISLLAVALFAWLARPSRLKIQWYSVWNRRIWFAGIHLGLLLLAGSAIANVLGFVGLSQILGEGTLFAAFTYAILYTLVRVLSLGLTIVLGSSWFQSLPDVRGAGIERWALRLLIIAALFLWLDVNLYAFTLHNSVVTAVKSILQYPVGLGKVQVTLGGTLNLVALLFLGYVLANLVSFVLGKILLPKLSLQAGMAYAMSKVTYYVLLGGLFFAGLTNAGLELGKFTVITGALGLGVGFGLQNIVNNFASGLIILFERPIRIGDTVEIGGVVGIVRRIGARSSTVLTVQGAEVILPNSNLLSNQVANWTLSSTRRRVEIPVAVSFGADPEMVLKLLTGIATSNPRVLAHPRPETLFVGFGESALNFELRFWAAQPVWFELKSQVSLAVLQSLRKAEIDPSAKSDVSPGTGNTLNKMIVGG